MRIFRHSRKADLNLSVQAIVILIFAVIMLGLGLGLINFIFGAAREKVGGALDQAQLTNPPSADYPLTMENNINIKYKGQSQVQIGYYNKKAGTVTDVEPVIKDCKTADGREIEEASLPTLATVSQDEVEPGGTAGWNAILRLDPDLDPPDSADDDPYSGALIAGEYICKVTIIDGGDVSLVSDQFYLKVTS